MTENKPPAEKSHDPLPGEADLQLDTKAMKAFAHPLRMAMFSYLNDHGSATATTLAKHLGESTGQTSYHLRQLEKHGLVTEDTERGTGRERWWQSVGFSMRHAELFKDPANEPALRSLMQHQLNERFTTLRNWMGRVNQEPQEWIDASVDSTNTSTMNAAETRAMMAELMQVVERHTETAKQRADAGSTSDDDRRIRVYLNVFPLHGPGQG